jgi:hypothetical protein
MLAVRDEGLWNVLELLSHCVDQIVHQLVLGAQEREGGIFEFEQLLPVGGCRALDDLVVITFVAR